ncbi:MAG: hypothetical protein JWP97_3305 [Labilithrix sp.]|nr:hypothetical protein [Labilithrix sp.]
MKSDTRSSFAMGLCMLALAAGCSKKDEGTAAPAPSVSAPAPVTSGAPSAAPAADAAAAPAGAARSYAGKYTVTPGIMYVPADKDWAPVKWKNGDESKLVGDGELALSVDGTGRVTGTSDGGPLGAAIVDGASDGQTLTATIRRKDPLDEGLTGTLVATIAGDKLEGSMKLAEFTAAIVRVATVTASRK